MDKVLIHINSLGKGGAERVVSLLSRCFIREQIEVVIATQWEALEEYPLAPRVRRISVGLRGKEEEASSLKKQWIRLSRLRKCIRQEKPDVILSFCVKANYRAILAAAGSRIPVIASVRSDPNVEYVGGKKRWMNKWVLNRAAGCVFQTREAQSFFDRTLQAKSRVIPNPVDRKYLQAVRKTVRERIVCVGRPVWEKNHLLLVKAFARAGESYPKLCLDFYGGDGECRPELEAYIRQQELEERVHFMGLSSTLEEDLADAAMFVLSSNHEGMPNALMEAMAMGLPVVSTDCPCGGSRYWIKNGENGLLVPVGDEEAMAEAIVYLLQRPEEARMMGEKARERLQEASLDKVYQQWKEYLEEVVSQRG